MHIISVISVIFLITADQLAKKAALIYLAPVGSYPIINGVFELSFVMNEGASFGIMQGGRWFFVAATPFALIAIVIYYLRLPRGRVYNWVRAALVMIFSGAFGNFIDRVRQGYVIDYFYARFINFPVFNIADVFIVTGAFLFAAVIIFFVKDEKKDGGNEEAFTRDE